MRTILNGAITLFTLFTIQNATAGEIKVGAYTVHCEMQGRCAIGGNPNFICTFVVDQVRINTTVLAPVAPGANIDVALGEKTLKGQLTSYYGQTCGVRGDFKTTSPEDVYRGDI